MAVVITRAGRSASRVSCAAASLLLVAVMVAGCDTSVVNPTRKPEASGMPLPTLVVWPMPTNPTCGGVVLGPPPFTLEGSPTDGVYGLLGSGHRVPVLWPPGYRALFTPTLVVVDPSGNIVARAGLRIDIDHPIGSVRALAQMP